MAIYSLSQRTIVTAAGGATWEIIPGVRRPRILEIGLSQVTAVAGTFGIGRPAAIGIDPTTPVLFQAELQGDQAATSAAVVAWTTTPPTVPTVFFRRVTCPATIGAGFIFTFPRGLYCTPSTTSIVIWVIATAPVCDVWAVLDE